MVSDVYGPLIECSSRGSNAKMLATVFTTLAILSWSCYTSAADSVHSDYAIQPTPNIFIEEPQSRTVLAGSSVSFTCNTSSVVPAIGYSLPRITWRVNGSTTLPGSNWISTLHSTMTSSELLIRSAETTDTSYIECLVQDGKLNGHYILITSSRRARLRVIDQISSLNSSVSLGHSLHLPCFTGEFPDHVLWYKNGDIFDTSVLPNGDLLLLNVTMADSGRYMCQAWFGQDTFNNTILVVPPSDGQYARRPRLLLVSNETVAVDGSPFSLHCYLIEEQNTTSYDFQWLKDGRPISIGVDNVSNYPNTGHSLNQLQFASLNQNHSGSYQCRATSNSTTTHSDIVSVVLNVTVLVPLLLTRQTSGIDTDTEEAYRGIDCAISISATDSVYCYKNGEDIHNQGLYFNRKLNRILVLNGSLEVGVYQCFVKNAAGSNYSTTRVLNSGFVNPPSNLECQLVGSRLPVAKLTWHAPTLNTWRHADVLYKVILYPEADDEVISQNSTTWELRKLKFRYTFSVSVHGRQVSAATSCVVFTEHLVTMKQYPLDITCSNDIIYVKWNNPANGFAGSLQHFNLTGLCIHGTKTLTYEYSCGQLQSTLECYFLRSDPELRFNATDNGMALPDGAVCLFGGDYEYSSLDDLLNPHITTIPTASYAISPRDTDTDDLATVNLCLWCSLNKITVSWVTNHTESSQFGNITIEGRCQNLAGWKNEFSYVNTTNNFGIATFQNGSIPERAICSFYGNFYTSDGSQTALRPVQCITEKEDGAECVRPVKSTAYYGSMSMSLAEPEPSQLLTPNKNEDYIQRILVPIAVLLFLILVTMIVLFVWKYCMRRIKHTEEREAEKLQDLVEHVAKHFRQMDGGPEDLFDMHPNKYLARVRDEDTVSEVTLIAAYGSQPASTQLNCVEGKSMLQGSDLPFVMERFLEDHWTRGLMEDSNSCKRPDSSVTTEMEISSLQQPTYNDHRGQDESKVYTCTQTPLLVNMQRNVATPGISHNVNDVENGSTSCSSGYATESNCTSSWTYDISHSSAPSNMEYHASKIRELEVDLGKPIAETEEVLSTQMTDGQLYQTTDRSRGVLTLVSHLNTSAKKKEPYHLDSPDTDFAHDPGQSLSDHYTDYTDEEGYVVIPLDYQEPSSS